MWERWADVASSATGTKSDYRLDPRMIGRGGQATVAAGVHRATGLPIALQRLLPGLVAEDDARRRLAREVSIGTLLDHDHAVPVLDAAASHKWFVMPLADTSLDSVRADLSEVDDATVTLVRQIAQALEKAHAHDWAHRDVKPANILRYGVDGTFHWAIADWGLGRRPAGTTSAPGRTVVGREYGTERFAPPEMAVDAHAATAAADVYSLGQVIGWLTTGKMPLANVPLLPVGGPWRRVVAVATRADPALRPPTMADFLKLVDDELAPLPEPPTARLDRLLEEAQDDSITAAIDIFEAGQDRPDDFELCTEYIARLDKSAVKAAAKRRPELVAAVVEALASVGDSEGFIPLHLVARLEQLALDALDAAIDLKDPSLAAAAAEKFCQWDDRWDRWNMQDKLRVVLKRATGSAAVSTARVLRRHPTTVTRLTDLAQDTGVEASVGGVLASDSISR